MQAKTSKPRKPKLRKEDNYDERSETLQDVPRIISTRHRF